MATDVTKTLRKALSDLEKDKERIDRQIVAIRNALAAVEPRGGRRGKGAERRPKPVRKAMSAAQRKAVGRRMKAYWAKRKAEAVKSMGVGKK